MTRPQGICWSEVAASEPAPAAPLSGMILARPCRRGTPTRQREMSKLSAEWLARGRQAAGR